MPQRAKPSFGFQILAALLAAYAMGGVMLVMLMLSGRYAQLRWEMIAVGAAAFAVAAGSAALTVWRMEKVAARWLLACGATGALLCLILPASAPVAATRQMWIAAGAGAALFLAFLVVAAAYVRRQLESAGGRSRR